MKLGDLQLTSTAVTEIFLKDRPKVRSEDINKFRTILVLSLLRGDKGGMNPILLNPSRGEDRKVFRFGY